jgi:hypothetical protein
MRSAISVTCPAKKWRGRRLLGKLEAASILVAHDRMLYESWRAALKRPAEKENTFQTCLRATYNAFMNAKLARQGLAGFTDKLSLGQNPINPADPLPNGLKIKFVSQSAT